MWSLGVIYFQVLMGELPIPQEAADDIKVAMLLGCTPDPNPASIHILLSVSCSMPSSLSPSPADMTSHCFCRTASSNQPVFNCNTLIAGFDFALKGWQVRAAWAVSALPSLNHSNSQTFLQSM